jgi:glutamate-ammonia-ligase adenylyltransferase
MGFAKPSQVAGRVRAWHHGHIRATRDARSRELLTELMPRLLTALADQADPDGAFARFDEFLSAVPAGVQLFSLFRANPRLLALVADLMGIAPRLAGHLSRNVGLFEELLAPDFFEPLPDAAALRRELEAALGRARDQQDALDATRRWAQRREFRIGLHVLLGLTDGDAAGEHFTAIAGIIIEALLARVGRWFEAQHGRIGTGAFAVVGLGKLGSRELTIGSDLDLIFVYDAPEDARSDGERPLAAPTYYARLSGRLISALTAPTSEGRLYEIDTRLRPSCNVGPVACSIANFRRYQLESAQTWEHQALTRARPVAGDRALQHQAEAAIRDSLMQRRDPVALAHEVAAMRDRIFREHGDGDPWNLKHAPGGLVEAEFIAQFLQLRFAADHPAVLTTSMVETFERAALEGLITLEESRTLVRATRLFRRLQAVLRLSVTDRFDAATAPAGLREALVRAAVREPDLLRPPEDFEALQEALGEAQTAVAAIFASLCRPDGDG